ncbi:MAG: hypothetical protein E6I85_15095 [Chloroflexi bacterium]|nr:MAG: hypothetical protein E6I85_15095 [Chloroflexota bacterium]
MAAVASKALFGDRTDGHLVGRAGPAELDAHGRFKLVQIGRCCAEMELGIHEAGAGVEQVAGRGAVRGAAARDEHVEL